MGKGRKRILTDADIANIIEAFQLNETLTKREIAYKYQISLFTLYKVLPSYLKSYENFPKFKTNQKEEGEMRKDE